MIQSFRKRKTKESRDKTKNPNLFNRPWKAFKIKAFNLLVELTASSELTLIKHEKRISIIKQKKDASNNKICKLENKNKENQYKCELLWHPTAATTNFHWRSQRFCSPPAAAGTIPIKFCSHLFILRSTNSLEKPDDLKIKTWSQVTIQWIHRNSLKFFFFSSDVKK